MSTPDNNKTSALIWVVALVIYFALGLSALFFGEGILLLIWIGVGFAVLMTANVLGARKNRDRP